jgi:hypothetical protein
MPGGCLPPGSPWQDKKAINDILRMVSGAPIKHRGAMGPVSGFRFRGWKRGMAHGDRGVRV